MIQAWMHYSGAKSLMDANPGMYQSMVDEAFGMSKDNEYAEVIYRDLHRTFPDNPFFCCAVPQQDGSVAMNPDTNPNLLALQRILMAFSIDCPHIGYCQSLNFIAGILLLVMENEEHAFWMLHVIVNDYLPEGMFDTVMEGVTIEQTVLMHLVYDKMPGVWNKFGNKKCFWECENADNLPTITLVTSHWFLTLYINILPVEVRKKRYRNILGENCHPYISYNILDTDSTSCMGLHVCVSGPIQWLKNGRRQEKMASYTNLIIRIHQRRIQGVVSRSLDNYQAK